MTSSLLLLGLTGCDDDDSDESDDTPPADQASLRVVHASPDAPAVDVYAAGSSTPLVRDLAYGEASDYVEVPAGSYTIEVRAAGAEPASAPVYSVGPLTLGADAEVTAVAAGFLAGEGDAAFRVLALAEDFDAAGTDTARVRVVHAGADAPTVGIDVGDDGSAEVAALARFADTGAAGVELPAGEALQLGIRAGETRVTAFTTPALPAGGELFVIATGSLAARPRAADGFGLLAVGPDGVIGFIRQNPVVYALHAGPDAPAVDVFAGAAELIDDLAFGELSAPLQVPPGTYDLDFFAHAEGATRPEGEPAASASTPALAAGGRYLAIATGFLGSAPAFQLVALSEEFEAAGEGARVRLVHAAPDVPAVDVGTVDGSALTPVWSDVAFGEASEAGGTAVPAASLTLGAGVAGSGSAILDFSLTTTAGLQAFGVAVGSLGAGTVGLALVDASVWPWTVALVAPND